jgi:LmbE family N-acetylglucosaminyl deacetylase
MCSRLVVPGPDGRRATRDATNLAGLTILGVFAHPDDESLACGGTLARASDGGARVVVFCASRGEAGSTSDAALVPGGDLGPVRTRELRDAARVLGITQLVVMDHPDGDLRWTPAADLRSEISLAIVRSKADAVITFDEDGLYWHPDHIGMHEHTDAAIASLGPDAPPLYYVTIPQGVMRAVIDAVRMKSGVPPEVGVWGLDPDAFGHAASRSTFVVDVRDWVPRKLAALRCHRTQIGPHHALAWISDDEARRWLGAEHFRRSPLDGRGGLVLETLGEPVVYP